MSKRANVAKYHAVCTRGEIAKKKNFMKKKVGGQFVSPREDFSAFDAGRMLVQSSKKN